MSNILRSSNVATTLRLARSLEGPVVFRTPRRPGRLAGVRPRWARDARGALAVSSGGFVLTCAPVARSDTPDEGLTPRAPRPHRERQTHTMSSPRDPNFSANSAYVEALHRRYLSDPASVPGDWALFFA